MALQIPAGELVTIQEPKEVQATHTRIRGAYFNFDNTTSIADIAFGTEAIEGDEDSFHEKRRELWALSGTYYTTAITIPPVGETSAEVFLTAVAHVIGAIQSDATLKQTLLDSGELRIANGNVMDFLGK